MNNIEDKIKKEFQQREIQPSIAAWDNLSKKLDSVEESKSKKEFIFFKIAAVLIGLLVALTFYLGQSKKTGLIELNEMVNSNKTERIIPKVRNETILEAEIVKATEPIKTSNKVVSIKVNNSSKVNDKSSNKLSSITGNTITLTSNVNVKKNHISKENHPLQEIELVADLKKIKNKEKSSKIIKKQKKLMNSSDADIDNMLASVMDDRIGKKHELVIVNSELTYAAERELDSESKYRILKVIKTGVDSVESLVTNNNN